MKKTYIIPEALTVVLGIQKQMMTGSPEVEIDPDEEVPAEGVDVKGISDTKLWDDLW